MLAAGAFGAAVRAARGVHVRRLGVNRALCGAAFAIGLWAPTVLTLCADIMPRGVVGTMTGLSSLGAGLGGILLMPALGWLIDRYWYAPAFVVTAVLPPIGFALLVTLTGTVQPVPLLEDAAATRNARRTDGERGTNLRRRRSGRRGGPRSPLTSQALTGFASGILTGGPPVRMRSTSLKSAGRPLACNHFGPVIRLK